MRLYGPAGALLDSSVILNVTASGAAVEVGARATTSGTFTVVATDASGFLSGSGTYRLKLAKTANPIVISPGDEGGVMTNEVMHTGTIDVGDLDVWNFTANTGDSIVVRMGEIVSGSSLTPWLRLYGPNGALLDSSVILNVPSSGAAVEVGARATTNGTFTVVATDASGFLSGNGSYRLKLAKTGSP